MSSLSCKVSLSALLLACVAVLGQSEVCEQVAQAQESVMDDEVGLLQYSTELKARAQSQSLSRSETDGEASPGPVQVPQHQVELRQEEESEQVASSQDNPLLPSPEDALSIDPVNIDYGASSCRCIGLDRIPGDSILTIDGKDVKYPPNYGSRCAPWHQGYHPDCLKEPIPDWCAQPFCLVDPCSCSGEIPRVSPYMTNVLWQNKHMFYSYPTCGAVDLFTPAMNPTACVNQKTEAKCNALSKCSWSLTSGCVGGIISGTQCAILRSNVATVWGSWSCACIGQKNKQGYLHSTALNVNYTAQVGSTCSAWHDGVHPDCLGDGDKPAFCTSKWCYVDPCTCSGVIPKVDNIFPGGDYDALSLFYSYDTCGNPDTYTATQNPDACSQQMSEQDCAKHPKRCLWTFLGNQGGYACRGIEVATNCVQTEFSRLEAQSGTSALSTMAALTLAMFSMVM